MKIDPLERGESFAKLYVRGNAELRRVLDNKGLSNKRTSTFFVVAVNADNHITRWLFAYNELLDNLVSQHKIKLREIRELKRKMDNKVPVVIRQDNWLKESFVRAIVTRQNVKAIING